MTMRNLPPTDSYGVRQRVASVDDADVALEMLKRVGYAVIESGLTSLELDEFGACFDRAHAEYVTLHGRERL